MAQEIEDTLKDYPNIQKYFGALIHERLQLPFPKGDCTDSIAMILKQNANPKHLEDLLQRTCHIPNFDSIFEKLGNDPDPDEKIYDAIAHIQAIDLIRKRSYEGIRVVPTDPPHKTVDLTARHRNQEWAIEVKHLRGVTIKRLSVKRLKGIIDDAIAQIEDFLKNGGRANYMRAVVVVSRRPELWDGTRFAKAIQPCLSNLLESDYQGKLDHLIVIAGLWKPTLYEASRKGMSQP